MQEQVRNEFIKYIEDNGVKVQFVAEKIGVARETLYRFTGKSKQKLHPNLLNKIAEYIHSH